MPTNIFISNNNIKHYLTSYQIHVIMHPYSGINYQ